MLDALGETASSGLLLTFRLLWIFVLRFAGCVGGKTVDEGNDNLLDVDGRLELRCGREKGPKRI